MLTVTAALAQDEVPAPVPEGYQTGYHIVRPGENLRRITRNYLGSEALWESNWRLNPDVDDPHFLLPGRRLLVLLRPQDAVPSAQVVSVSGTVSERPDPIAWTPAQRLDLMVESDGIQTAEQSSTGLRFHDGTSLILTEDSIVFLKQAGRTLRGIETRSVEIVEGQADLAGSASGAGAPEIEFLIGDATGKPKPGASGRSEARFRKADSGSAQLMIYEGASEVEAGGQTVQVGEGMGTSVPEGAAPLPPEKLLPEPVLANPEPNAQLELGALGFSWEAVEGAESYTVEVCVDPACEGLISRAPGQTSTTWKPEELPLGEFVWRITAVSPSGLDGYPAAARPVSVVAARAEFEPPTARFELRGPSVERTLESVTRTFYSATAQVEVMVEDPSGVASWQPVIDGEPSQPADLGGGWAHGEHTVAVLGEDRLGNRGETESSISFAVDAEAPKLSWRIGASDLLQELTGRDRLARRDSRWWQRRAARANARRVTERRAPEWTVLAWGNEKVSLEDTFESDRLIDGLYQSYRRVRLTGRRPVVLILAPGIVDPRSGNAVQDARFLVIEAEDGWAGVEECTLASVGSATTGYRLRARCVDRLGNVATETWGFGALER